ncbi:type II toxin-antitoxin system PemK/MazF family toxin [Azospirillum sp. YIM B02556]|uniref:Type II toxin-antitoxin system PemK/MazF family toxin n=1 Tax=Azospirillum endophyticum TaxID=2800326 RepID=A0ABS1FBF4_9PROT|nr:type II toxin-antitoxin system PemK/MazF family toxin [Azospirillum endophyticum]MBK1840755.1 type II toxin-antitoxin system PemK/MazF family toxin [Azospirillum endophyticum]
MMRGEIWTVAGGAGYAGKPRPVVILQDDRFSGTASVTVCPFTIDPTDAPLFRRLVEPTGGNGLAQPFRIMADKIMTVPRAKVGHRVGTLEAAPLAWMGKAVLVFLGLAGSGLSEEGAASGQALAE